MERRGFLKLFAAIPAVIAGGKVAKAAEDVPVLDDDVPNCDEMTKAHFKEWGERLEAEFDGVVYQSDARTLMDEWDSESIRE